MGDNGDAFDFDEPAGTANRSYDNADRDFGEMLTEVLGCERIISRVSDINEK